MSKQNIYKGHRYVPKIMGEWDQEETYEGLSIVTYQGTSYTSKKRVPVGINILDEEYWVVTGNYDTQVENYRQDVKDYKQEITEQFAQVVMNVKSLGATGNGIDSDVDAIIEGSKDGVTLGFPDGTYVIDSHVLIENKKKLKWIALGSNVTILDTGKKVILESGQETKGHNGIKFLNCDIEFIGFETDNLIEVTGRSNVAFDNAITPLVDFEGGNVVFKSIKTKGLTQPYFNSSPLVNPEINDPLPMFLRSGYYRFYNNERVVFEDNTATEIGGGELYMFGKVKQLIIKQSKYQQGNDSTSFWSYAKTIDCEKVMMNDLHVESRSTGSFIDVSGEHIVWENIDLDYPNGKFIDMTQEWGYANVNTKLIEIKNCKTNADQLLFTATHDGTNIKTIDKVIVDNVEWNPSIEKSNRQLLTNRYVRNMIIKNMDFHNVGQYVNFLGEDVPLKNKLTLDNVTITNDKTTASRTQIEVNDLTIIENSYINMGFHQVLEFRDRTVWASEKVLSDSNAKIIIRNSTIENTEIETNANVYYEDCTFINVTWRNRTNEDYYPNFYFTRPTFTYENDVIRSEYGGTFVPIMLSQVHDFRILDCKEIKGSYMNGDGRPFINIPTWDLTGVFEIDGVKNFNVTRIGYDNLPHNTSTILVGIPINNTNIEDIHIYLNKITVGENSRGLVSISGANASDQFVLEITNSRMRKKGDPSIDRNRQLISVASSEELNTENDIDILMTGNTMIKDSYNSINTLKGLPFKNFSEGGNVEY